MLDVLDRLLRPLRRPAEARRYPDVPPVVPTAARGLPELDAARCDASGACVEACPTRAIRLDGMTWSLDAGACVFCGACARACPRQAIRLGSQVVLATFQRDLLRVDHERRPAP